MLEVTRSRSQVPAERAGVILRVIVDCAVYEDGLRLPGDLAGIIGGRLGRRQGLLMGDAVGRKALGLTSLHLAKYVNGTQLTCSAWRGPCAYLDERTQAAKASIPSTTVSKRIEWNRSNACWPPGSSA